MAEGDVADALSHELQALADELENAPREHQAVLVLGELASYLADWHPVCRDAALRFAAMTSRAADALVGHGLGAACITICAGKDVGHAKLIIHHELLFINVQV